MKSPVPRCATPGRGAVSNTPSRYRIQTCDPAYRQEDPECDTASEPSRPTRLHPERARSIISHNESPDVPFARSINPYRGCEHGCIYCFARPSHTRLGWSAGLDFESEIYWKPDAARLLEDEWRRPSYRVSTIHLGANTDPYQPVEKRIGLTRSLLERFLTHRHPVTVLTKGALIERDLDLLAPLARQRLTRVAVSLTTLDARLKRTLEPRAASPQARLRAMRQLTDAGIPVAVMVAPVIPRVTDAELEDLLAAAREAGAQRAGWILLRLPLEVEPLMREWLETHRPHSAKAVYAALASCHDGRPYDARFHHRQQGSGAYAAVLQRRFEVAARRLGFDLDPPPPLDDAAFLPPSRGEQLSLLP